MDAATQVSGCSVKPAIPKRPTAVSVNGRVIPREAIARETQNHPASAPIEAWRAAARALVVRELLLDEARRIGLVPAPLSDGAGRRETDDEALVRQIVEVEVVTPRADEANCRRYYDNNRSRFRSAALHEVRHILIAAAPGDAKARKHAIEAAGMLISAIREEPARFTDFAKLHSACPSRETGGNLGQIGPGQTVPEFEAALARAPIGVVAETPCETRYGQHVLFVERRIEGRDLPFDLVRERIADWLEERVRRTAVHQFISMLAKRAVIAGVDMGVEDAN